MKKLEKMNVIAKVQLEGSISFNFPKPEEIPPPLLKIEDGKFGYTADKILYEDINFGIDMDSRIAILGANGAGKSTLIKILTHELQLLEGQQYISSRARYSLFTQHHMDQLDLLLSPLEQLQRLFPDKEEQVYRKHLGMFNICGEMQI